MVGRQKARHVSDIVLGRRPLEEGPALDQAPELCRPSIGKIWIRPQGMWPNARDPNAVRSQLRRQRTCQSFDRGTGNAKSGR